MARIVSRASSIILSIRSITLTVASLFCPAIQESLVADSVLNELRIVLSFQEIVCTPTLRHSTDHVDPSTMHNPASHNTEHQQPCTAATRFRLHPHRNRAGSYRI